MAKAVGKEGRENKNSKTLPGKKSLNKSPELSARRSRN
jgi:hypothetical protein